MPWVKIRDFQAIRSNGNQITIEIWDEHVEEIMKLARYFGPIPRRLQLLDGRQVDKIDDDRYVIVETGEEITSNDPNAT